MEVIKRHNYFQMKFGNTQQKATLGKSINCNNLQMLCYIPLNFIIFRLGNLLSQRVAHQTLPVSGMECPP